MSTDNTSTMAVMEITDRQVAAIQYHNAGYNYTEIARMMGCSPALASKLVKSGIKLWGTEEVDEFRRLKLVEYQGLRKRLYPYAVGQEGSQGGVDSDGNITEPKEEIAPDLKFMRELLRIGQEEAKLMGAYPAEEIRMTHVVEEEPASLQKLEELNEILEKLRIAEASFTEDIEDAEVIEDAEIVDGGDIT